MWSFQIFSSFSRLCWLFGRSWRVHVNCGMDLSTSAKQWHWTFDGDCFETINCMAKFLNQTEIEDFILYGSEFSYPIWTWNITVNTCFFSFKKIKIFFSFFWSWPGNNKQLYGNEEYKVLHKSALRMKTVSIKFLKTRNFEISSSLVENHQCYGIFHLFSSIRVSFLAFRGCLFIIRV